KRTLPPRESLARQLEELTDQQSEAALAQQRVRLKRLAALAKEQPKLCASSEAWTLLLFWDQAWEEISGIHSLDALLVTVTKLRQLAQLLGCTEILSSD